MTNSATKDKRYLTIGICATVGIVASLFLTAIFWPKSERTGLSCIAVKSNINNLITIKEKRRLTGTTLKKRKKLMAELSVALKTNKKLNCGFSEEAILRKFK